MDLNEYAMTYGDGAVYHMRCRSDTDATRLIKYANELSTSDDAYRIVEAYNWNTMSNVMPN